MSESLDDAHVDQLRGVRSVMERWAALEGHDRCWHHNDILKELCSILDVQVPNSSLPSREEFAAGCEKYQRELYGDGE